MAMTYRAPRKGLLVVRALRPADALPAADAPDRLPEREQPERASGDEPGRFLHDLVRTGSAGGQRVELDPNGAGQGLVHDPAPLWSAGVLVRQDLEAWRDRAGFRQLNNDEMKSK